MNQLIHDEDRIRKNIKSLSTRVEDNRARTKFLSRLNQHYDNSQGLIQSIKTLQAQLTEISVKINKIF